MQSFSALLNRLILTPSRNAKLTLLSDYFRQTPDPDRGWALAILTGELSLKSVKASQVRSLIETRMDDQLFRLSYDYVGDLAETVSLVWPERPGANAIPSLSEIVETLQNATRKSGPEHVERWLDALDADGRWALLKIVTGGLRIGVSARLARQATALFGHADVTEIEEIWHGLKPPYEDLFAWLEGTADKPSPDMKAAFRPVMLAHPLLTKGERDDQDALDETTISGATYAAEWKWDGIRIQASCEGGEKRLYSRTGDDISHTFPDVLDGMNFEGTIDGELLVRGDDGDVAGFGDLQKRLNRKTVSKKLLMERPAFIRAYDVLFDNGLDVRTLPFSKRRKRLENLVQNAGSDRIDLSPLVPVRDLETLNAARNAPPHPEIEGLMLKRWDSLYLAGRPKGLWFKWKRDPYTVDAIIMYAQRGHGRRSSLYSDFTFGVWTEDEAGFSLAPVGKAYFGFTDEELKELDKFVRNNTIDRFGPVRSVTANRETGLVVEVAFEGLQESSRHKSGVAMRFPRFNRIRWDKPPAEADTLDGLKRFLS